MKCKERVKMEIQLWRSILCPYELPDPLSQLNFFFNGYQILFTNFLQILIQRCTFPVGY